MKSGLTHGLKRRWRARAGQSVSDILTEQIDVAIAATRLANRVCSREAGAQESRRPMRHIEHEGDSARANLVERIDRVLTVPLEREDLFRASRCIDDVTDDLRDMVRELAMWDVPTGRWSQGALDPAVESLKELRQVILADSSEKGRRHCIAARRHARKLRRAYQNGLTRVFAEPLDMNTIKKREILRRIDSVGVRLTEASDALLDGMVKRYL